MTAKDQIETNLPVPPQVRRFVARLPAGRGTGPEFLDGDGNTPEPLRRPVDVVLAAGDTQRAREWLTCGAARVLLGDAALNDSEAFASLATEAADRVGVYLPAARMRVRWTLDCESNACFRTMTPSVGEPCFEILTADGGRTGTQLQWWLDEMFARGAAAALVRADIVDDTDLNLLRGLTERWGERLWVGPLDDSRPDYDAWVTRAQATQLVAPPAVADDHPYLMALRVARATTRGVAA